MKPDFLIGFFLYLSPMEFVTEIKEGYTQVKVLNTELTETIALSLKAELVVLTSTENNNILLDISECKTCDLAGVNVIATANRLCKNSNGVFLLAGVNSNIEELISMSVRAKELNIAYNQKIADQTIKKLIADK